MRRIIAILLVTLIPSISFWASQKQTTEEPLFAGGPLMTPMVQVSPKLMEKRLIKKVAPEYPEQGQGRAEVVFEAVINKSGKVASLNAVSGPRKFMEAASDAVREYVYTPYVMDNGERAFVKTTIKVNFAPTHNK